MANEIRINGTLTYAKGNARASLAGSGTFDQTGEHYVQTVADVGTTEEELDKGDIGTIGWVSFRNMDDTNYVEIGAATGEYTIKLDPLEYQGPMKWNGAGIFAKANTAPCQVEYLAIEA